MATLEITTRIGCKNNCSYCPQDALVKAYKARSSVFEMSFDLFKRCVDKVPNHVRIDFSGMAEPWLNRECTRMLLYAHEKGFDLAIYTTLVGMSSEDLDALVGIQFRQFMVHLPDGDSMTTIKVDAQYLQLVERIKAAGFTGLNFMTIGSLHPALQETIGDRVNIHGVVDRAGNLSDFPGVYRQQRLNGIIRCKSCGDKLNHNVLLPNGDIILCCMDYGMQHTLGNLATMRYEEIFSRKEYRSLQLRLDDDSQETLCRYCENAKRSRWNLLPGAALFKKLTA